MTSRASYSSFLRGHRDVSMGKAWLSEVTLRRPCFHECSAPTDERV